MNEAPSAPRTELAHLRREAGLTQAQLAAALGLRSPRAVVAWERGDYAPSVHFVLPLARILGVSLQEVVEAIAGPDPGAAAAVPDLSFLRPDVRRLVEARLRESAPHEHRATREETSTAHMGEALHHHISELGRLIRQLQEEESAAIRGARPDDDD